MTPEQNIQGHAFNALTYALADGPFIPLSDRDQAAKAVVAAVEPLIVKRAVADAYKKAATWCDAGIGMALEAVARDIEAFDGSAATCPCCEETTCDDDCPLAPVRARWQASPESPAS